MAQPFPPEARRRPPLTARSSGRSAMPPSTAGSRSLARAIGARERETVRASEAWRRRAAMLLASR